VTTRDDVRALAIATIEAWSALDLDAVVARHHPGGTFEVVGHSAVFEGREEMRMAFEAMLAEHEDAWFEQRTLVVSADAFVVEHVMYVETAGKDEIYARPIVDVCTVRDGLVDAKRSYLAPATPTAATPLRPPRPRGT
jgi:ketosteroid isomerase-like protein